MQVGVGFLEVLERFLVVAEGLVVGFLRPLEVLELGLEGLGEAVALLELFLKYDIKCQISIKRIGKQ